MSHWKTCQLKPSKFISLISKVISVLYEQVSEERKTKAHHIAADINNIVIVLLRWDQPDNWFYPWTLYSLYSGWKKCKKDFLR